MKILQIQTGGDEFFLPDNEVKCRIQNKDYLYIYIIL